MHHIWEVSELRVSILELLDAKKDYATVALVCKDFWASAIPLLWKEVKFEDVLGLFGDKLVRVDRKHSNGYDNTFNCKTCPVFTKPLEEWDMERFRLHAIHIRRLVLLMRTCPTFPDILEHLNQCQPLWPKLHELVLRSGLHSLELWGGTLLPVIFAGSLKHLTFTLHAKHKGFTQALLGIKRGVTEVVEALETLDVRISTSSLLSPEGVNNVAEIISAQAASLKGIRLSLSGGLPLKIARAALMIPGLKQASFSLFPGLWEGYKRLEEGPRLTHLTVDGAPLSVKHLLRSLSSTSLQSLNLNFHIAPRQNLDMQDIVDSMSMMNGLEHLRSLTLHVVDWASGRSIAAYPVCMFHKAQRLHLCFYYPSPCITAAELQIVAQNMPRLTHVHIDETWLAEKPNLTLHDLQPLGKYCLDLQFLHAWVSGRAGDLDRLAFPMHSVTVVTLQANTPDDPAELVAEYIRRLWPNLRRGCTYRHDASNRQLSRSWTAVWDLVGAQDLSIPVWEPGEDDDWRNAR